MAGAAHRTKAELERLVAERFPRPDVPGRVEALPLGAGPAAAEPAQHAPGRVEVADEQAPGRVGVPSPPPKLAPLAPERYALQVTISQETYEKLRYAQALLGHAVPSGDLAQVLDRSFDSLIRDLERRWFAPTTPVR